VQILRRALPVLFAALLLLAGAAWMLARQPPTWWSPPAADDAGAMALAESLERRLMEEISRVRPDESPWAVRLSEAQLNAWLALRLPRWIAHAGERVRVESQVHLVDGGIEIAVRPLDEAGGDEPSRASIGVLRLVPELRDGALVLGIGSAGIGRLSLPGVSVGATGGAARELAMQTAESLFRSMLSEEEEPGGAGPGAGGPGAGDPVDLAAILRGQPVPPRWPLGDGRSVELLDIELRPGAVIVQCATRRSSP
jgi:hypothetical protein